MLTTSNEKNTGPTPGPWRVEDVGFPPGHLAIMAGSSTEYRWLATVGEDLQAGIDWTQTQANARLVAAAPMMAEALLAALWWWHNHEPVPWVTQTREALRQAGVIPTPTLDPDEPTVEDVKERFA